MVYLVLFQPPLSCVLIFYFHAWLFMPDMLFCMTGWISCWCDHVFFYLYSAFQSSQSHASAWCRWWGGISQPFTLAGRDLWLRSRTTQSWERYSIATGTFLQKQRSLLLGYVWDDMNYVFKNAAGIVYVYYCVHMLTVNVYLMENVIFFNKIFMPSQMELCQRLNFLHLRQLWKLLS